MESFNIFKKSTAPCSGSIGNRKAVAPKRTGFFSLLKKALPLLLLFFCTTAFSQTLLTDYYPLCVGFGNGDDPPPRGIDFTEHINDPSEGSCFQVCEDSEVNYWFIEPNNIESVLWEAEGGTVINDWSTPEHKARVKWGEPGQGFLTVEVTYTNNTVIERVLCVDITPMPIAMFEIAGFDGNKSCTNASIMFENLSEEGLHYQWDFGDYAFPDTNYSSQFEPEHIYQNPGTYTVTLTVTNSCNCKDIHKKEVHIEEAPPMLISCPAVVCEYDIVTYTVNDPCPGGWEISGGNIVSGGNGYDFVEVVWDDVDDSEGFGYIHYLSGCGCPFWTTEKIPVVTERAIIQGNETVCVGEQQRYTLPQWPTTEYNWSLTPNTNPDQLVWVDQRNEVIIEGLEPGNYTLRCEYKNTLLGCEGFATKLIKIFPKIEITGDSVVCANAPTPSSYNTVFGENADWVLTFDGLLISQAFNTNTFTYPFPYTGTYILTASSGTSCASDPFIIQVLNSSTAPFDEITGPEVVCVGQTYTYSCAFSAPGTILVWSIVSGDAEIQGGGTGNSVSIKFTGGGPYEIMVKRMTTPGSTACYYYSESTLLVDNVDFEVDITHNYSTPLEFCPSSTSTFTADFGDVTPDYISWELSPPGFGSINEPILNNSPTVTVNWNEVSGGIITGELKVTATVCGNSQTETITVQLFETPQIAITNIIPDLCPEKATIDVTVNVTGSTSGIDDIMFTFGNQTPPVTLIETFTGNGTYTVSNLFTNTSATDISQNLKVTLLNPNGCSFSPSATQSVTIFPQTVITVFPAAAMVVLCPEDEYSHILTSNLSTGDTESADFQWLKDGNDIPSATSHTYTINNISQGSSPEGIYVLKVIDINGCTVYSQSILVIDNCEDIGGPQEPPCEFDPEPEVGLYLEWEDCGINALLIAYPVPGIDDNVVWEATQGVSLIAGDKQTATFNAIAGLHTITAVLVYDDEECMVVRQETVEVNYVPEFNIAITCNNNGTYDVSLQNNSMIYDIEKNDITFTYTGTNITGFLTGEDHLLTNVEPGEYAYTLTLSATDKPTCEVEHTITLDPMPDPDGFTVTPAPASGPYCLNETFELTIDDFDDYPGYTFVWDFNGNSYIASEETTEIGFNTSTNIILKIYTPMGCTLESDEVLIEISASSYSGTVAPATVNICEGEAFAGLTFTSTIEPGIDTPDKVVWMNGNEVAGISSPYSAPFFPTESGLYWVLLENADGCRFVNGALSGITHANVTIRKRPYVDIFGSETLCFEETMTLIGDITDDTLERQWLLDNVEIFGWNTATPLEIEVNGTTPGTYVYTLNVRPVGDEDCGNSVSIEIEVYDPVPVPVFDYTVLVCEPYTVELAVISPQTEGNYNWSNGDNGETITVYIGGAYQVTYTDPNGCTEVFELTVPHHTERYMWMVPKGCFDICPWDEPAPYIIGPWAEFDYHEWLVNDRIVYLDYDSPVSDLTVNQPGTYQLIIEDEICRYESEPVYISPNQETLEICEISPCELDYSIDYLACSELYHECHISGAFHNIISGNPLITITVSSFNGYGTYTPGNIIIPPTSSSGPWYTYSHPFSLTFTPSPGFYGGDDYMVISIPGVPCVTLIPIHFPVTEPGYRMAPEALELTDSSKAMMKVTPNPSEVLAVASYNLGSEYGKADYLLIHNMSGILVARIDLSANSGDVLLDISRFPSGVYLISLQADGQTILHQKLIKK